MASSIIEVQYTGRTNRPKKGDRCWLLQDQPDPPPTNITPEQQVNLRSTLLELPRDFRSKPIVAIENNGWKGLGKGPLLGLEVFLGKELQGLQWQGYCTAFVSEPTNKHPDRFYLADVVIGGTKAAVLPWSMQTGRREGFQGDGLITDANNLLFHVILFRNVPLNWRGTLN